MTGQRTGLLIVNADDFGLDRQSTDAILECFQASVITSTTAMVWMSDSDRAARLAHERTLPVGLHLNLIEPFTAGDVPPHVAATQLRVVERLRGAGSGAYIFHPRWARDFEQCISDQLARFDELYGRPPTHVDGHRHQQLVLNALFARALAPVARYRRPVNRGSHESRPHKHLARSLLFRLVRLRFLTTDWCFSIRAVDPGLGDAPLHRELERAGTDSVEVVAHPGWDDERAALLAPRWRDHLNRFRAGSYADLSERSAGHVLEM